MVFAISIGFVKREEEVSARVGSSPSHIPPELLDNDAASARYLLSRSKTVTMQIKLSLSSSLSSPLPSIVLPMLYFSSSSRRLFNLVIMAMSQGDFIDD